MHFTRNWALVLAIAAAVAPACVAFGQELTQPAAAPSAVPAPAPVGDFQVTVAPALWLSRVRGNTTFGGPNFTVDDELGLNAYEGSINGEVSVGWGEFYEAMLTGWYFSTDASLASTTAGSFGNATIAIGDRLSNSFSAASVGGEFDVTLWQPFADQVTPWSGRVQPTTATDSVSDDRPKADLRFKAIGAVRWYGASLTVDDQTSATSGSWTLNAVMPGIGGGIELDLDLKDRLPWVDSLSFEASGAIGSNFTNEQYFTFIRAGITANFTPSVGVSLGYRLEDFKLNDNSATFDGGVQGLFIGADIKF